MNGVSDKELVEKYLRGDEKSFEILVKRYLKPIYSFIYRYVYDRQAAEDITQEVFLKIWRNIKKFDQSKSFKTWIFVIAKNSAFDFIKKNREIPFSAFENEKGQNILDEILLSPNPASDKILEQKDEANALFSSIKKLPPKYSQVLFLYYKENFTFQEIADILGESINTVKSRHRRAIAILKKSFLDSSDSIVSFSEFRKP